MTDKEAKELAILTRNLMYKSGATINDEDGTINGYLTVTEWCQLTGQPESAWESVKRQMIVLDHHLDILPGRGYYLGNAGGPGRVLAMGYKSAQTLIQNQGEILKMLKGTPQLSAILDALREDVGKRGVTLTDLVLLSSAANLELPAGTINVTDEFSQLLLGSANG